MQIVKNLLPFHSMKNTQFNKDKSVYDQNFREPFIKLKYIKGNQ